MSSILETAITGINAMKIMMDDTVNKIKNPSYQNKKTNVVLEKNNMQDPSLKTALKVKEIYDDYNDFVIEEKRKTNERVYDEETKIEQLLKLEDLLCEKSNIFNELIGEAYAEIEKNVLLDNSQNKVNEKIHEKLNNITFEMKDLDKKLTFLEKDIKQSIINHLKRVNELIDEIHNSNIDIRYFPFLRLPNKVDTFIDKRDELVDELNNLIGIKVVKNHDSYKVFLNNGICVIDDDKKQNLIPLTSHSDDKYISVGFIDNNTKIVQKIEDMIPSATIGALLKFRKEELANTRNKIGQLTVNFADSINSYNTLGHDMFGHVNKQIFNISTPQIISSSTNLGFPITSATWVSTGSSKPTDYILYFKNNNWTVARLLDHTQVLTNIRNKGTDLIIGFDGIEFSIKGQSIDGDIYMVKPYSKTLERFELLIDQKTDSVFSKTNISDNQNNVIKDNSQRDFLFKNKETIDEEYQRFSKSIAYECNELEEALPFKKNMIKILSGKKIHMSENIEQDYQNLNYQQECYLANVKVLKIAESIFNEIIECYS